MKRKDLLQLMEQWSQMTMLVLELKAIPTEELQELLKRTYQILSLYCNKKLVPKEVCKVLLEMEGFLYFASIMEGKEVDIDFYYYQTIDIVVTALKEGFFGGKYVCKFPDLMIRDAAREAHIINLQNGNLQDLL